MFRVEPFQGDFGYTFTAYDFSGGGLAKVCSARSNRVYLSFTASPQSGYMLWPSQWAGITPGFRIVTAGGTVEFYWELHGGLCTLEWWAKLLQNPVSNSLGVAEMWWDPSGP